MALGARSLPSSGRNYGRESGCVLGSVARPLVAAAAGGETVARGGAVVATRRPSGAGRARGSRSGLGGRTRGRRCVADPRQVPLTVALAAAARRGAVVAREVRRRAGARGLCGRTRP